MISRRCKVSCLGPKKGVLGRRGQRPIVSAGTAEEAIVLGTSAPKPHAGSSDGDTAIELLCEVVTWSVLVWFARQRGMKNWVCDGLVIF